MIGGMVNPLAAFAQNLFTPGRAQREVAALDAKHGAETRKLTESITSLKLQIEDRGWNKLGQPYEANGLDLGTIKIIAKDLAEWVAGGGIMKRVTELRGNYFYGDGFGLKGVAGAEEALKNENNIAKLFSVPAMLEINRAHCTDGMVTFLVHKKTKEIIRVPLEQLEDPHVDSSDPERIWYIRRKYTQITTEHPKGEVVDRYIAAVTCPADESTKVSIPIGGDLSVQVDAGYTAVVWKVNSQIGWALGIPDLLASLQWAEKYTLYLKNQAKFAEALAAIAWEYSAASVDQAKGMAATLSKQTTAGTSVNTPGMELKPMAGNSDVTFTNGAPLAAQAAAAGEVPVASVLSEATINTAGTVDPDFIRVILARRESMKMFIRSLGPLLGAPDLEVVFFDLEQESPYREAQLMIAANGTGLFKPEEIRGPLADKLRVAIEGTAPEGYLLPNNEKSLELTAAANHSADPEPTEPASGSNNGRGDDELGVGKLSDGDNTARDKGE